MYVKVDEGFADNEMALLSELLTILDEKIFPVNLAVKKLSGSVSEWDLERAEYLLGVGLVAIQQYLSETLVLTGISKKDALNLGPMYSGDVSIVSVINAAANWWKHSPDWFGIDDLDKQALRTIDAVEEVTDANDYHLSNVVSKLLGGGIPSLCALLASVIMWRSEIDFRRGE